MQFYTVIPRAGKAHNHLTYMTYRCARAWVRAWMHAWVRACVRALVGIQLELKIKLINAGRVSVSCTLVYDIFRFAEGANVFFFLFLACLWFFRSPKFIPGWGSWFEKG